MAGERRLLIVGVGLALLAGLALASGGSGSDADPHGPSLLPPDGDTEPEGDHPMLGAGSSCTAPWLALPRMARRLGSYNLHGSPGDPDVLALMNSAARAYVTPPNGKFIWSDSQIVSTFDGKDVRPKFANWHRFEVGGRLRLPGLGSETTAIYKVLPKGAM